MEETRQHSLMRCLTHWGILVLVTYKKTERDNFLYWLAVCEWGLLPLVLYIVWLWFCHTSSFLFSLCILCLSRIFGVFCFVFYCTQITSVLVRPECCCYRYYNFLITLSWQHTKTFCACCFKGLKWRPDVKGFTTLCNDTALRFWLRYWEPVAISVKGPHFYFRIRSEYSFACFFGCQEWKLAFNTQSTMTVTLGWWLPGIFAV